MISIRDDEPLWCEKYRPQTIADTILPAHIKKTLQSHVDSGVIPNQTFSGGPGVGKTTAARAMFTQLKADYYFINSSMNGNIDTLRTDIADFASSVSFTGNRKYVVLDEADNLNPNSTQLALRGFIEEFSRNCGFILTCNFPTKILDALRSRCPVIDFAIPPNERETLAEEFFMRAQEILSLEEIKYQPVILAEIITKHFPDWRRVLNVLQNSVRDGKIGTEALSAVSDDEVRKLYKYMKSNDFSKVREWAAQYGTDHPKEIFRTMYSIGDEFMTPQGMAQVALSINTHEYNAAFVANQEINLVAAMVEIMADAEFK